jgi:hypothetical protein
MYFVQYILIIRPLYDVRKNNKYFCLYHSFKSLFKIINNYIIVVILTRNDKNFKLKDLKCLQLC